MKEKSSSFLLGFLILGIFFWLSWRLLEFVIRLIAQSDPRISAALVAAIATVFVGLSVAIFNQSQIRTRGADEAHRAKKVEIYDRFLKVITSTVAGQNSKISIEPPQEQELADYLFEFKREIILWGSPEVIKCQLEFESVDESGNDIFIAVDNLYKAIRKDIGLSNKGLDNRELVKMYLLSQDRRKLS